MYRVLIAATVLLLTFTLSADAWRKGGSPAGGASSNYLLDGSGGYLLNGSGDRLVAQ